MIAKILTLHLVTSTLHISLDNFMVEMKLEIPNVT